MFLLSLALSKAHVLPCDRFQSTTCPFRCFMPRTPCSAFSPEILTSNHFQHWTWWVFSPGRMFFFTSPPSKSSEPALWSPGWNWSNYPRGFGYCPFFLIKSWTLWGKKHIFIHLCISSWHSKYADWMKKWASDGQKIPVQIPSYLQEHRLNHLPSTSSSSMIKILLWSFNE